MTDRRAAERPAGPLAAVVEACRLAGDAAGLASPPLTALHVFQCGMIGEAALKELVSDLRVVRR